MKPNNYHLLFINLTKRGKKSKTHKIYAIKVGISVTHSHSNLTMILKTNKFQNKSSVKILSILKKNDISNNAKEIQTH